MRLSRREFLTSSALLGAAAAAIAPLVKGPGAWFQPAQAPAVGAPIKLARIMRVDAPAAVAFERGVRGGLASVGLAGPDVEVTIVDRLDVEGWSAPLKGAPNTVVIGMVREADFIVLNELVRESGARLLYQATHAAAGAAHSRHAFTTTAASVGLGAVLAQWLAQQRQHALVQETAIRSSRWPLPGAKPLQVIAESWPERLGQAAALVGTGRWQPCASAGRTRVGAGDPLGSASAGFVSFVCVS